MPIISDYDNFNTFSFLDDDGSRVVPGDLPPDEGPKPDPGSPLDNPNLRSYWWERFTDITNSDPLGPIGTPRTDDEIAAEFEFYNPGRALDLPLQNLSSEMRAELEIRRMEMQFLQDAARAQVSYDAQRAAIYEADAARANIQDAQLRAEFDALMQKYFDSGGTDTASLQAAQAIYNQTTANGAQLTGLPADWAIIMGTTVVGQVNVTDSPSIIQTNSYWQTRLASWSPDNTGITTSGGSPTETSGIMLPAEYVSVPISSEIQGFDPYTAGNFNYNWESVAEDGTKAALSSEANQISNEISAAAANNAFQALAKLRAMQDFPDQGGTLELQLSVGIDINAMKKATGGSGDFTIKRTYNVTTADDVLRAMQEANTLLFGSLYNRLREISSPVAWSNGNLIKLGSAFTPDGKSYPQSMVEQVRKIVYDRVTADFPNVTGKSIPAEFTRKYWLAGTF